MAKKYWCYKCGDFMEFKTEVKRDGRSTYSKHYCVECGNEISPGYYDCPECGAETREDYTENVCELHCEETGNRGRCINYLKLSERERFFDTHWCWSVDEEPENPCLSCEFYEEVEHKGTLIDCTEAKFNYGASIEFGGQTYDWIETHKCWNCGTVFEFENSSY